MVVSLVVNDNPCTHYIVFLDKDHLTVSRFLPLKPKHKLVLLL
jgi:hypothetical protein